MIYGRRWTNRQKNKSSRPDEHRSDGQINNTMSSSKIQELAALLEQTGHAHHQAFIESDGADPEWALWYASHLQNPISDLLQHKFTQSLIIYELVRMDKTADIDNSPWPEVYAMELLERYG